MRHVIALLPKSCSDTVTPSTAQAVRELCSRTPALRRELPVPPSSADAMAWSGFRALTCSALSRVSDIIKAVGVTERKALKLRAARQRRADFEARRYRLFLEAAEERQRSCGGITAVATVPDAAGRPSNVDGPRHS